MGTKILLLFSVLSSLEISLLEIQNLTQMVDLTILEIGHKDVIESNPIDITINSNLIQNSVRNYSSFILLTRVRFEIKIKLLELTRLN